MRYSTVFEEGFDPEAINPKEFPFLEWAEKYIPFKLEPNTRNSTVGHFQIPGSYAPAGSGHDPAVPITFKVNISGSVARRARGSNAPARFSIAAEDVWNHSGQTFTLQVSSSAYITYSNNMTGMRQANFEGNIAFLIYATVTRIIKAYTDKFRPDYVNFSAAHSGLIPIYHILCMRAEKTFGYKYINPRQGKTGGPFYVLSPQMNKKMVAYLKTQGSHEGDVTL